MKKLTILCLMALMIMGIVHATDYNGINSYTPIYDSNCNLSLSYGTPGAYGASGTPNWIENLSATYMCWDATDGSLYFQNTKDTSASFCLDRFNGIIDFNGNNHTANLAYVRQQNGSDHALSWKQQWSDSPTLDVSGLSKFTFAGFHNNNRYYQLSINQTTNGSFYFWQTAGSNYQYRCDGSMWDGNEPRCELENSMFYNDTSGQPYCHIWVNNEVELTDDFASIPRGVGYYNGVFFTENSSFNCNNHDFTVNDLSFQSEYDLSDNWTIRNCHFINNDTWINFFLMAQLYTPNPTLSIINNSQDDSGALGPSTKLDWSQQNYLAPWSSFAPVNENFVFINNSGFSLSPIWETKHAIVTDNNFTGIGNDVVFPNINNTLFARNIHINGLQINGDTNNFTFTDNNFPGVFFQNANDISFVRNNLTDGGLHMVLDTNTAVITDNNFIGSASSVIFGGNANNILFARNNITDNELHMDGVVNQNITVLDNNFPSNAVFQNAEDFTFAGNIIMAGGVQMNGNSKNAIITDNDFQNISGNNIVFENSNNTIFSRNNLTAGGFNIVGVNDNVTISHNRILNVGDMSCLGDCDADPSVFNASSYNNWIAVRFEHLTNSEVSHNYFENISGLVEMTGDFNNNQFIYNTIVNVGATTRITSGEGNNISNNDFFATNQTKFGYGSYGVFEIRNSNNNIFSNNDAEGYFQIGYRARGSAANNVFDNNYFNQTMTQAYFDTFKEDGFGNEFIGLIKGMGARDTASDNNFTNNIIEIGTVIGDHNNSVIADTSSGSNLFDTNSLYGGDEVWDQNGNSIWICNVLNDGLILRGATNQLTGVCSSPVVATTSDTRSKKYKICDDEGNCWLPGEEPSNEGAGVLSLIQDGRNNPIRALLQWLRNLFTNAKWQPENFGGQ